MPAHKVPLERQLARGNPSKRALPEIVSELPAANEIPEPPDHLGEKGLETWNRLWTYQVNASQPWISEAELNLVTRYCEGQDTRADYQRIIRQEGRMSEGASGQSVVHPAVRELRQLDDELLKYEAKLGLTPSDRAGLGLAIVSTQSKLQKLMQADKKATRKGQRETQAGE